MEGPQSITSNYRPSEHHSDLKKIISKNSKGNVITLLKIIRVILRLLTWMTMAPITGQLPMRIMNKLPRTFCGLRILWKRNFSEDNLSVQATYHISKSRYFSPKD